LESGLKLQLTISQVFKVSDIFTFSLTISGIIRMKTPNARPGQ